jgi:hypothetical protein
MPPGMTKTRRHFTPNHGEVKWLVLWICTVKVHTYLSRPFARRSPKERDLHFTAR